MKVIIKDKHTGYHEGAGADDSVGISKDVGHTVVDFISQRLTGAKTWLEVNSLVPDWNNIFLLGYF